MATVRIRNVENKREFEKTIEDYITLGYRIVSGQGTTTVKVKKTEYGGIGAHILIAIVTAWWTFFLGNIAYLLFKYLNSEEVLIRLEEKPEPQAANY